MKLSEAFSAVAHKRLSAVDLPHRGSHQHELNGVAALRDFFEASGKTQGKLLWIRFSDDDDPTSETGEFTFYDARAKSSERTGRSEWRLYYTGDALEASSVGDLLILARSVGGEVFALVFEAGSGWEAAARSLFPEVGQTEQLSFLSHSILGGTQLGIAQRMILEQLGIDYALPATEEREYLVLGSFGMAFPSTTELGALARARVEASDDPDALLLAWLDEEEQLFRALERLIVGERIETGFDSVDDFVSFSLSVQNRRKSRAGHAFENQLAALFELWGVSFTRQVRTERNRTADFVFPGGCEYHDSEYPTERLTLLAAKTTCKDRWPQVLADGDRVPSKHLGTLDAALSGMQIEDMRSRGITPVMPNEIRAGYPPDLGVQVLSLAEFLDLVKSRAD